MANKIQPDGDFQSLHADSPVDHHHPLVNVTSASSSHSSVLPAVFSEGSRSRSNTPSSRADSGDEKVTSGQLSGGQQSNATRKSPDTAYVTSQPLPRTTEAPASRSGHSSSRSLEPDRQEAFELDDFTHPDADVRSPAPVAAQDRPSPSPPVTIQNDNPEIPAARYRTNSIWSYTPSWRPLTWPARSITIAQKNMSVKNLYAFATLTIALFAAASAAYFAYATYRLTFVQVCLQAQDQTHELPPECDAVLKGWQAPKRGQAIKRQGDTEHWLSKPTGKIQRAIPIALIVVAMVLIQLSGILLWQSWIDSSSRSRNQPWHYRSRDHDPFAPTNVRMEPRSQKRQVSDQDQRKQSAGGRRIMPVLEKLPEQEEQEEDQAEPTQYQADYDPPTWKRKFALGGPLAHDERFDTASSIEPPVPSSSASEDEADNYTSNQSTKKSRVPKNELTNDGNAKHADQECLSPNTSSNSQINISGGFLQRFHFKRPRLPFSSDDHDIEPPLTALGADDDMNENDPEGQNALFSGHVAIGLSQAGAALAATAGGAIGKNILVQLSENETDRLHNMLTTGISRTRTLEEADYDLEREGFVSGEGEHAKNAATSSSTTHRQQESSGPSSDLRKRTKTTA